MRVSRRAVPRDTHVRSHISVQASLSRLLSVLYSQSVHAIHGHAGRCHLYETVSHSESPSKSVADSDNVVSRGPTVVRGDVRSDAVADGCQDPRVTRVCIGLLIRRMSVARTSTTSDSEASTPAIISVVRNLYSRTRTRNEE